MYCTPTRTASKCGPNVVVRAVFKVCVCVWGGGGGGGGGLCLPCIIFIPPYISEFHIILLRLIPPC